MTGKEYEFWKREWKRFRRELKKHRLLNLRRKKLGQLSENAW